MPELTPNEQRYLPQLESFLLKGVGADRAFRYLREFHGIVKGTASPIRRSVVRALAQTYRQNLSERSALIPTQRSRRLTTAMAVQSRFRSPVGSRYLLDYTFTVTNSLTGEKRQVTHTLGLRRLERMGFVQDEIKILLDRFNNPDNERYLSQFEVADHESIKIERLIRTTNK